MCSASASARKPMRPRLTPSTGISTLRANSAARRNVPSPPSTKHQFATLGGALVGVDHLDLDARARACRRAPGAAARGRRPRRRAPAARSRCRPALSPPDERPRWLLRGRCAPQAGCCVRTVIADPPSTARRTASLSASPCSGLSVCGPQPQEVLDVAGRTGQRAGGDTDGVPARVRRRGVRRASTASARSCGIGDHSARRPPDPCRPRTVASPWERYRRRLTRTRSARAAPWPAR